MRTEIIQIRSESDFPFLKPAAEAIRRGELVAFPTETVYGLGANAFMPEAVKQIFVQKGRPQDNPLIAHLSRMEDLPLIAAEIPRSALSLLQAFTPGPLTIILKKTEAVPEIVTAGLNTVAIRFPSNPVARALIEQAKVPIVAPSANLSGKPSPTRAWHVLEDLDGKIPYIIDGGACTIGLESTIVDLSVDQPEILRPGYISAEDIYKKTGIFVKDYQAGGKEIVHPKAPGQKYRHYAPKAKVMIIETATSKERVRNLLRGITDFIKNSQKAAGQEHELESRMEDKVRRIGLFLDEDFAAVIRQNQVLEDLRKSRNIQIDYEIVSYSRKSGAEEAAYQLFDQFRLFDKKEMDLIICTAEPKKGEGIAYMNRLQKAASYHY